MCCEYWLGHACTEKSFIVYLKCKFTGCPVFLFADPPSCVVRALVGGGRGWEPVSALLSLQGSARVSAPLLRDPGTWLPRWASVFLSV